MDIDKLKETISQKNKVLIEEKEGMINYLKLKLSQEDWHGVADAAMDIREIVSKISIINDILLNIK